MSEERTVAVKCKNCQKTLLIPDTLTEFSCIYCGTRMKRVQHVPAAAKDASFDITVPEKTAHCLTTRRNIMKAFMRSTYMDSLQSYTDSCREPFDILDYKMKADPENADELLAKTAALFMDDLEADWQSDPKSKSKARMSELIDNDRLMFVAYFLPMILDLPLENAEKIANALKDEWQRRYPNPEFSIATKDTIFNGFTRRLFGFCFITTAVCEFEGKPDDCYELTTLRAFRDGYLRSCPDGQALIDEYYEIAPAIVMCIDNSEDRAERYRELREKYIDPCIEDIENGRMEACKERYVRMVRSLKARYLERVRV